MQEDSYTTLLCTHIKLEVTLFQKYKKLTEFNSFLLPVTFLNT